MGHDINNMNQVALGFLELALDLIARGEKIEKQNDLLIAKPFEMLKNSSALIDSVKKVQRERMGMYETIEVDIGEVLAEVKAMFTSKVDRDVTINYEPSTCKVYANELLKDVFINLVGNAVKHGGRPLTIRLDVTSESIQGQKYCMVSVEDNGPGLPDETKKMIFEHLTNKVAKGGRSGFGLYMAKTLIDDYHGRFWVEDRVPGDHTKGARFVVMLQMAKN
jgi:signal transduction histidine kinase